MNVPTDERIKILNTILLSVLSVIITAASVILINLLTELKAGQSALMIQSTINSERIAAHNEDAIVWKNRIEALEIGNAEATKDRYTRAEAMRAIEQLKDWVDKYYQRK